MDHEAKAAAAETKVVEVAAVAAAEMMAVVKAAMAVAKAPHAVLPTL